MIRNLLKIIVLLMCMAMGFILIYALAIPLLMLFHGCDLATAMQLMTSVSGLRLVQTLQAVLVFVLPVFLMLRLFKTDAADFLHLRKPSRKHLIWAVLSIILMMPFMNLIVAWNESLHLPESMAALETWLRQQEDAALQVTQKLTSDISLLGLILNLLIMALLTGFAEEVLFRGGIQGMMTRTDKVPHVAIWLTAFLFSAIHMQFYGFIPRMLIGAWLGYLLVWSGSLWVPVAAHAMNNALVVLSEFAVAKAWLPEHFAENIGTGSAWGWAIPSAVSILLVALYLSDSKFSIEKFFPKRK